VYVADTEDYGFQRLDNGTFDYPDTGNDRIQKFDNNGTFITKWGSKGDGDGQFNYPAHIAVDRSGNLYIADTNNYRIQKIDNNGTFITKWGVEGSFPLDDIAFDHSDNVYVADAGNDLIQKFDKNGTFITKWETIYPQGIGVDSLGNVYVSNSRTDHTVKIFGLS
jgi:tripartite motif-containing protein 71